MFHAFFRVLAALPLSWLHRLGSVAGYLTFWLSPGYRTQLRANLAQAGFSDTHFAYPVAANAGQGLFELPYVWMRSASDVLAKTTTSGWELVTEARNAGRGIIFLTPHLGCFEVTAQYFAINPHDGAPITVLFRRPRQAWLLPLVVGHRARENLRLAPADFGGVRLLARALKRGEAVGLLPDQVPSGGEGVWSDFFGRSAYTMTLPARLQQMTGATILLAYGDRKPAGCGWVVRLSALPEPLTGTLTERTAQINTAMEALIRQAPAQYLWGYNRYKVPRGVSAPGLAS